MANQNRLYDWWWGPNGPQSAGPFTIKQIDDELLPAKLAGVAVGKNGKAISGSGWNYAVLKFLIEYCELPDNAIKKFIFYARNSKYRNWKDHPNVNATIKLPTQDNGANGSVHSNGSTRDKSSVKDTAVGSINLIWRRFYSFIEALSYSGDIPTIYMQTSRTGRILRIGKAALGLGTRYNRGYDQTFEAAMWESGNAIFVSWCKKERIDDIEVTLINKIRPELNKRIQTATDGLELTHNNIVIQNSRVVSYYLSDPSE